MAILSVHTEARAVAAWSIPVQALPVINPARIWIPPAERREITDEELELIEMRYQQTLALRNLEDLFAEGQLNCL